MKQQDQQELTAAFAQFNSISQQLIGSYQQLEQQVCVLNEQLDEANRQLLRERDANKALAERLSLLLEALPAGVIELSDKGDVVAQNPAAVQLLGQSVLGQAWQTVLSYLQYNAKEATYVSPKAQGQPVLTLRYQAVPGVSPQIVLLHDVSQLHALTYELASQRKLAAMGSMAAALAHQLRTPLSAALLYTANVKQATSEADKNRFVDKSLARLQALETLIQNMLSFVKGHATERECLVLGQLLEDVVATMKPQLEANGIIFQVINDAPISTSLWVDGKALQGALLNLLENGLHVSRQGDCLSMHVLAKESQLVFLVQDQGPGLTEAIQDKLFEPFFTTRATGTGLGLAIVKKVTEALGGYVRAYNRQEKGACFELCIPLKTD